MVAHLNVHTSYDLLNSSIKIKDVIAKATKEGYTSLEITDTNDLYGYTQFYIAFIAAYIKKIFSITIYLTGALASVVTIVIVKNNLGLKELFKLSSAIKMILRSARPLEWPNKYIDH